MAFDDDDLSRVPLHKRDEIRRRIAAVKRYVADPRKAVLEREATILGISVHSLKKLAQAWRGLARPESLAGAGAPRKRRNQLDAKQRAVIVAAADQLGDADLPAVMNRAFEIATEQEVAMPGKDSVRTNLRRILAKRIPGGSFAVGADFVLEHCAVDLPVCHEKAVVMPLATIVIETATNKVLGVTLSVNGPSAVAAARALAAAFASGFPIQDNRHPTLALNTYQGLSWQDFTAAINGLPLQTVVAKRTAAGRVNLAVALLGDRHRGVWLRPRLTSRPADRRVATVPVGGKMLSLQQAEAFLTEHWIDGPPSGQVFADQKSIDRLFEFVAMEV